ncbi:MAG TPA: cyclic nucleotide-binding domain-containing protein, partial [Opitutaceae bacterium]
MDLNLILSAQTLILAPQVQRSGLINGLVVLKNVPAKTYLRVTSEELLILQQFEKPRTVPDVLGAAIGERFCLPLGEFYELVLKGMRAKILLDPGQAQRLVETQEWKWNVRPRVLERPLAILFFVGLTMALVFQPKFPSSFLDWVVGIALLSASLSFGNFVAACLIGGAGGEVYRPRWRWLALPPHFALKKTDAIMLTSVEQSTIGLAAPAVLATAAGIAAWHEPGWAFFSLLGLAASLRPIFGGSITRFVKMGKLRDPSDAEQEFLFPPNRRPKERVRLLRRALAEPTTWARIVYGVVWTIAVLCWGARLGGNPPWSYAFWEANGNRIALGIGGSLGLLCTVYLGREIFFVARTGARARRRAIGMWRRRWFGRGKIALDESGRTKLLAGSQLFTAMQPTQRQEIALAMTNERHGPWRKLNAMGSIPKRVSIIASGKVALRRQMPSGRTVRVQVLSEGDIIGMQDLADPTCPHYQARTITPVVLFSLDRGLAEKLIVQKVAQSTLADSLLKAPFLRQIPLCRNWHIQAVNRFARLSSISNYVRGDTILSEGQTVEEFFIIFQGDAKVTAKDRQLAVIHAGEFFGEIGLMQNSAPNASVTALLGTRCLRVPRSAV